MKKLSVTISGHRTSVTLESEFIAALRAIAKKQNRPVAEIIGEIDAARNKDVSSRGAPRGPHAINDRAGWAGANPGPNGFNRELSNLSSATRVWVLKQLQS